MVGMKRNRLLILSMPENNFPAMPPAMLRRCNRPAAHFHPNADLATAPEKVIKQKFRSNANTNAKDFVGREERISSICMNIIFDIFTHNKLMFVISNGGMRAKQSRRGERKKSGAKLKQKKGAENMVVINL